VAGPEASRFIRTNEPERFPASSEVERKLTNPIDTRTAQSFRDSRFQFNLGMFHVKLCAADNRVAIGAFAFGMRRELSLTHKVVH
jgi:hypothetical protein